jgi:hypothetical protein
MDVIGLSSQFIWVLGQAVDRGVLIWVNLARGVKARATHSLAPRLRGEEGPNSRVVPANAGIHTSAADVVEKRRTTSNSQITSAGGYGSLLSQGRH